MKKIVQTRKENIALGEALAPLFDKALKEFPQGTFGQQPVVKNITNRQIGPAFSSKLRSEEPEHFAVLSLIDAEEKALLPHQGVRLEVHVYTKNDPTLGRSSSYVLTFQFANKTLVGTELKPPRNGLGDPAFKDSMEEALARGLLAGLSSSIRASVQRHRNPNQRHPA